MTNCGIWRKHFRIDNSSNYRSSLKRNRLENFQHINADKKKHKKQIKLSKSNFIIRCRAVGRTTSDRSVGKILVITPSFRIVNQAFISTLQRKIIVSIQNWSNPWKHISLKISNVFLRNRKQKKNVQRLNFLASVETDSDSDGVTDSQRTKSNLQSHKLHCCYVIPKIHNCVFDICYKCSTHYLTPSTQLP